MFGLIVEFSLVIAAFFYCWRRQTRGRRRERNRERASQLDFDFAREQSRKA